MWSVQVNVLLKQNITSLSLLAGMTVTSVVPSAKFLFSKTVNSRDPDQTPRYGSFSAAAPKLWNSLPSQIRTSPSLEVKE